MRTRSRTPHRARRLGAGGARAYTRPSLITAAGEDLEDGQRAEPSSLGSSENAASAASTDDLTDALRNREASGAATLSSVTIILDRRADLTAIAGHDGVLETRRTEDRRAGRSATSRALDPAVIGTSEEAMGVPQGCQAGAAYPTLAIGVAAVAGRPKSADANQTTRRSGSFAGYEAEALVEGADYITDIGTGFCRTTTEGRQQSQTKSYFHYVHFWVSILPPHQVD
jgi:hypothetical protein